MGAEQAPGESAPPYHTLSAGEGTEALDISVAVATGEAREPAQPRFRPAGEVDDVDDHAGEQQKFDVDVHFLSAPSVLIQLSIHFSRVSKSWPSVKVHSIDGSSKHFTLIATCGLSSFAAGPFTLTSITSLRGRI